MRSAPATRRCTCATSSRATRTEVKREHGVGFSTRMGINSGEVVVGAIGDDLRMDYTAQGHTVGLAQRMESARRARHLLPDARRRRRWSAATSRSTISASSA